MTTATSVQPSDLSAGTSSAQVPPRPRAFVVHRRNTGQPSAPRSRRQRSEPPYPHETGWRLHPSQLRRRCEYQTARTKPIHGHSQLHSGRSWSIDKASPRPDRPIVFVGDLSRDKGVEVLMKAHRQLDTLPVLAGRAFDDTPVEASSRVELRGLLGHDAVIELLHSACVVVVPSLVPDCCPTVVLEAMALGRPVVAASSGGILDLVDDGVTGLLVTSRKFKSPCRPPSLQWWTTALLRPQWVEGHSNEHGPSPHQSSLGASKRCTSNCSLAALRTDPVRRSFDLNAGVGSEGRRAKDPKDGGKQENGLA